MKVKVLGEAGYEFALRGIGKSYGVEDMERLKNVAEKLALKDGGHNKFLESMVVWLEVRAARYWWQEFDTYRVGTTKQSESTIHTVTKKPLTQADFEDGISRTVLDLINENIFSYNKANERKDKVNKEIIFRIIKNNLPEGYLQTRIVCTNYKVLRNMIQQRQNHVLNEWHFFITEIFNQLKYAYLLEGALKNGNKRD